MAQMPTLATHLFTHSQPLLLSDHTDASHWLTADDPGAGEVDEEDEEDDEDDEDDEDEAAEKDEEDEDEEDDTDEEDDDDLEDEEEKLIVRR